MKASMNVELPKFFNYVQTDNIEDYPGFSKAVSKIEDEIQVRVRQELERQKEEIK